MSRPAMVSEYFKRALFLNCVILAGCRAPSEVTSVLTAEMPLHLEDHLQEARIIGSEVSAEIPETAEWYFDEPQPDWKAVEPWHPSVAPALVARTEEGLRVTLTKESRHPAYWRPYRGGIYVDVPGWNRSEWASIVVRARSSASSLFFNPAFNLPQGPDSAGDPGDYSYPFLFQGAVTPVVNDGTIQTHELPAEWSREDWAGPWTELGLWFAAEEPTEIEILSIQVTPKAALYAHERAASSTMTRGAQLRRTLSMHAPGRIEYRLRVPEGGRLDAGLGVIREDVPVTFRVEVSGEGEAPAILFEESYSDTGNWAQRSVDLSRFAGQTVSLALETEAPKKGMVALWGAPTVSGKRQTEKPNVIFYVLDGGGADYMSVYGYNRRTTPYLERLAREGAVFEYAYSNSSGSKPSTTSFMTSLHNSVLGNTVGSYDLLPANARTMAERLHETGYQTGVFVGNPWAATMSNLERGVDVLRDTGIEDPSTSSRLLHRDFWKWRESYPSQPYWVHFQTTDVHEDYNPEAPFAGLFVSPERRETYDAWEKALQDHEGGHGVWSEAWEKTGLDRVSFFQLHQGLHDECMAHNDYQLGRLVERLKAEGSWENTLLIIASDHSIDAAADDMGVAIQEELYPQWRPLFRSSITRVPLIFVWPGEIEGGQRFPQPVSMIDVLPTVLDLLDLPPPEVLQGQSLAPLLKGESGWESRPVILDEFDTNPRTHALSGFVEVIDGQWGASLFLGEYPEDFPEEQRRPTPLLLYDLWDDPLCLKPLNEKHPDLVAHYQEFLEGQWEAHQLLAGQFSAEGQITLTPEQLQSLRALGYIQ